MSENSGKYEATVLVRVDDMERGVTIGQRSIRIRDLGPYEDLDALMQTALDNTPAIDDDFSGWERYA